MLNFLKFISCINVFSTRFAPDYVRFIKEVLESSTAGNLTDA